MRSRAGPISSRASVISSDDNSSAAKLTISFPSSALLDDVRKAYVEDKELLRLKGHLVNPTSRSLKDLPALPFLIGWVHDSQRLLCYTAVFGDKPRVVVPAHNNLRLRIMYECQDELTGVHRGRHKNNLR